VRTPINRGCSIASFRFSDSARLLRSVSVRLYSPPIIREISGFGTNGGLPTPRQSVKCEVCCLLAALLALAACPDAIAGSGQLSPEDVQSRWLRRLDGRHFNATVALTLDRQGKREERRLTVWRDDVGPHHERALARFDEPPDMRGLALLYLENSGRPNDYFLYQPSTRRVRRIAEVLAREDIYGIDLEYLGFGLAQSQATRAESVAEDTTQGHPTLRLSERALESNPRFDRRVTWLDPGTFVPVQTVHYRGESEVLRGRTEDVRTIQGIPTPLRIVFEKTAPSETVTMEVTAIDYATPIPEEYFSTLALLKAAGR